MVFLNSCLQNEDIVCISTSDWDKPFGSKQQIMSVFSSGNRILYVEAQVSFLHILLDPIDGIKRLRSWVRGLMEKGTIYIYTPLPLLPFGNYSLFINRVNQRILLSCLRKLVNKLNFRRPILWIYSVNSAELLGRLKEKFSVYYCLDDFSSEIGNNRRKKVLCSLERKLLTDSDIVFGCTYSLCEQRKGIRQDIHFVRNGVDLRNFSGKIPPSEAVDDMHRLSSPRIGLVGTFDSRIDTDIVFFIAEQNPGWQIVLVGSNTPKGFNIRQLRKHINIHYLGFKKNELIGSYIRLMDVCIIPYHTRGFNQYIFPLKTLEYLAAGKPVVASALPELEFLGDIIYIAGDKKKFVDGIKEALSKRIDNSQAGKNVANSCSWPTKAQEISRYIYETVELNNGAVIHRKNSGSVNSGIYQ